MGTLGGREKSSLRNVTMLMHLSFTSSFLSREDGNRSRLCACARDTDITDSIDDREEVTANKKKEFWSARGGGVSKGDARSSEVRPSPFASAKSLRAAF